MNRDQIHREVAAGTPRDVTVPSGDDRCFALSGETVAVVRLAPGVKVEASELSARADAELPEDVPQVEGDGARAEEELGPHLVVA
jgi:hypothetical protein